MKLTRIQARKQFREMVLTKRGSHQIYNAIPKTRKWLTKLMKTNVMHPLYIKHHVSVRPNMTVTSFKTNSLAIENLLGDCNF